MPHVTTMQEKVPRQNAISFTPVHRGFLQRKCACGRTGGPTGECEECTKKCESKKDHSAEIPSIVGEVLNSPGQPLDPETRAFMEPRFGHDFGNVRVHTDAKAADSAGAVYAHAYTVGNDVVFGAKQFAPTIEQGRELLAHELAHTIQQEAASNVASPVRQGSALEAKAQQAGRDVASGRTITDSLDSSEVAMARQPTTTAEENEEETAVPMTLPTGKAGRSAPLPKSAPAKPPRRPPSQFEPGGFPYHLAEGGRILTDIEWGLEASGREEEERTKERQQKKLQESHDRLEILRGMLDPSRTGYIYTKAQIMAMITEYSSLDGQILRHYGVELPPSRSTKQKTFTNDVIAAIDQFNSERQHGASTLSPTDVKGLQARQSQQEAEAAGWEGYSYTTESALAGAGASAMRLFTDDPKKIAGAAGVGAATSGFLGAAGYAKGQQGTYSPQVEGPGPFANPVGPWRYTGPAPTTTTAPTPPPVTEAVQTNKAQAVSPSVGGGGGGGRVERRTDVTQGGPFPTRQVHDLRGNPLPQEFGIPGVPGGPDRVFVVPGEPGYDAKVYVVRGGREVWFSSTNRTLAEQEKRGFISSEPDGNTLSVKELQGKRVLDLAAGSEGRTVRNLREMNIDAHGMDIALEESAKQTGYLHRGDLATAVPVKGQFDIAFEFYGGLAYGLGNETGPAFRNAVSSVRPGGTLYLAPLSENARKILQPFVDELVKQGGKVTKSNIGPPGDEIWRIVTPASGH